MNTPQLLTDMANLMLLLAPSASLVCLVLAGISLRRETGGVSFVIGGGFTKWMFWAVVFLTLPGLLTWFTSFGVSVPAVGGGIGSSWLSSFQGDVSSFVQNFVIGRIVPVLAAFMVLRSILSMYGGFLCLMGSGLLRALETFASQRSWNDPDVYWMSMVSLVDWVSNVIMPIYAALEVAAGGASLASNMRIHHTANWQRHFLAAGLCLLLSGLLCLAEYFVNARCGRCDVNRERSGRGEI